MTESHSTYRRLWFWVSVTLAFFVFLFLIRSVLLPFALGMLVAYLLDPVADRLQKSGLSRTFATSWLMALFFMSLLLIILILAPVVARQFSDLFAALPGYIDNAEEQFGGLMHRFVGNGEARIESLKAATENLSGTALKIGGDVLTGIFLSGMAVVNVLSLLLITPIVAFYLLRDWDEVVAKIDALLPRKHADVIREQVRIIDRTLAGFIRGQLTVCAMLGVYYAIGLSLVGLKFGIVIGLATGILVILPYVGLMLGMAVGLGIAFFQFGDLGSVGMVLAIFISGQIIEGNFVTPKLVGDKVGLHPVWIIFGMLAGAALFGFVGILLAIPVTAIIGVLTRFAIGRYLQSSYYTEPVPKKPVNL